MITQFEMDGTAITETLNNVLSSLVTVLLQILAGFFGAILDWIVALIAGTFFDNPAVILIGLIFMVTAWKVNTSG